MSTAPSASPSNSPPDEEPKAGYSLSQEGPLLRVLLTGVLFFRDFPVANEIVDALDPLLVPPTESVVLDFQSVEWMDSHWLGFMMRIKHHAEQRKIPVRISNVSPEIRRLFSIVQFHSVFDVEPA
jgi:anti-anti-sigma factor